VLSTATATPRSCAAALAAARSVSRSTGLVGVSRNSSRVFALMAPSIAAMLEVST
jgi:hypothetical protein